MHFTYQQSFLNTTGYKTLCKSRAHASSYVFLSGDNEISQKMLWQSILLATRVDPPAFFFSYYDWMLSPGAMFLGRPQASTSVTRPSGWRNVDQLREENGERLAYQRLKYDF